MIPHRAPVGDLHERATVFAALLEQDATLPASVRIKFDSYRRDGQPLHSILEDPGVIEDLRKSCPSSVSLLGMDAPEHTRLRRMLTRYFTVRQVNILREDIQEIVRGRLDAMEDAGSPLDLMDMFALPIPSLTICALLGDPLSNLDAFQAPARIVRDLDSGLEAKVEARSNYHAYCRALVEQKRLRPSDDLLSHLTRIEELTDDELVNLAGTLFDAGHHTTANMIAFSVFFLLSQPSYWEALRADPLSIGTAVEELLRYLTIIPLVLSGAALPRTALEDVELDGEVIKAGETVTVSLSAANRDPERFADPDSFDLQRDAQGHLAFGYGVHMCLGQHLARLEMHVALAGLIERFPHLHLAVSPEEVPMHRGERGLYGVLALPVAF